MSLKDFMQSTVCLIKPDGSRIENVRANVQSSLITVADASVPIEAGDLFERVRSETGITEYYEVKEAGYIESSSRINAHYQSKVEKSSGTKKMSIPLKISDVNKVFLVHGHDDEMKHAVARIISKLNLEPIILHEQPNQGKTIIEKFESESDVGFAIVLMSPDDIAYGKSATPESAKPRARQNVVLELGYFVGKLGRERVMALKRGNDLEVPTDFSGVVYTAYDNAGSWRLDLVRELKACGYNVDANAIL